MSYRLGVVVHAFKTSIQEAGEGQWVQEQPGPHSKFQTSQRYIVRP